MPTQPDYAGVDSRTLGRLETKLEGHIESEELLLRTILDQMQTITEKLTLIREQLATHGERSTNQHTRIRRAESAIMWAIGGFGTIFTALVVALLTGTL